MTKKDYHSPSNCWQTPQWLFDQLNEEFNFGVDLCANFDNFKCSVFFTDYLKNEFYIWGMSNEGYPNNHVELIKESTCFMNPPYSNPKPFIEKAWEDSKHCKIVCLVKCDPSTKWWATFWNYNDVIWEQGTTLQHTVTKRGPKPGCEVRFFPKRIKFDPPAGNPIMEPCFYCRGLGQVEKIFHGYNLGHYTTGEIEQCGICDGAKELKKSLSGPTFPSALIIMDRRNIT
jgi:phage N-6-adenine-methyltransferase